MFVASFVQSAIGEAVSQVVSQLSCELRNIAAVEQETRELTRRAKQAVEKLAELDYAGEDLENLRRRHPSCTDEELVDWVELGMSDYEDDSELDEIISQEVEMHSYDMRW